jgi:hypothetical protein
LTNFAHFLEKFAKFLTSEKWKITHSCEPYSAVARKTPYTVNSSVFLKKNFPFLTKNVGKFVFF